MFNWIKLIERNMRRNLRRTILTILTIALATFIYTVLVSVPASMDRVVKDASGTLRLIINNKTAPWEDLPARYCDDIKKMPGRRRVRRDHRMARDLARRERAGVRRRRGPRNRRRVSRLRSDRGAAPETLKEKRSAIVGEILMHKYGWKIGDTVTLRSTDSDHMEMTFIITGTMVSKRYPNTFLMRRDYLMAARKAHGLPDEDIAWNIIVRANSNDAMGPLAKHDRRALRQLRR